jgi:hypothetical protein
MRFRLRTLLIALAVLPPLLAYVGSYYVLSRRGFRETEELGFKGFYFVMPEPGDGSSQANARHIRFYWPLIQLDLFLGTGRHPAADPLWGLDAAEPNPWLDLSASNTFGPMTRFCM